MNKICYGCGSKLQCNDPNKNGYVKIEKIKEAAYCQRCFKMIHYGINNGSDTPKDVNSIINAINKDNKFVIFLVDFLSINEKLIKLFKSINKHKLLLISKCDIIPKSIRQPLIINFIREYYGIKNDIKLISSFNSFGVSALMNYLSERNVHECYIVGQSNSGKSTLINKLMDFNDVSLNKIATSYIPNTTLDFIRLKLNEELTIIDSPGFILPSLNSGDLLKKNYIKSFIKPVTYQMKAGETLKLEEFYFNFSDDTSVTLYMSNEMQSKKYFKEVTFTDEVMVNDNNDLVLYGLGFINVKSKCAIKIWGIDADKFEVRESIFGGTHE